MKEIVMILYNYFQLFLLVPFIIMVDMIKTKRMKEAGILKTLVLLWVVFIIAFIPAIFISRTCIFYDEMTVWLEEEGQATIQNIDFVAGTINKDEVFGNEKIHIGIPYGAERKICIISDENCRVNMQMEKYDYEDSYAILGDNKENVLTIYTDTPGIKLVFELLVKILLVIFITTLVFEMVHKIMKMILVHRQTYIRGGVFV